MTPDSVETHLDLWPGLDGARATLINLSENHTFRLDGENGTRHILRVHRPGYQDIAAIRSELAWIAALAAETDIPVPTPLPGINGEQIQTLPADQAAGPREAVLFAFEEGEEPVASGDLRPLFIDLGRLAAKSHVHAAQWILPEGFARPVWDAAKILDANGLWGDWRQVLNVDANAHTILGRLDAKLREDLAAYGQGTDRFGLIHADMRLANLLVGGPKGTILIDFDDSGFGWQMYDFGAAMSFMEDRADLPELAALWCEGYRNIRPLASEHAEILGTMVMLRRMALLAWVGSHHETELAQSLADQFAPVTAELAERHLSGKLL